MISIRPQGIRVQMALLYLSLSGAGLIFFCLFLFQNYLSSQQESFDKALFNFAADVSNDLEVDILGRLYSKNRSAEEGKYFPFPLGKSYLEIRNLSGQVLLISKSLRGRSLPGFTRAEVELLQKTKASFQTIPRPQGNHGSSDYLRLVRYLAYHEGWPEPLILQVAVPMDLLEEERRGLIWYFIIAIPSFLLVVGILGVFLSRRALKPVQRISNRVKSMDNLKARIPVPKTDDEISQLAKTFNGLLDRLEQAFVSQDRFIANASHQLKTPLTILKGELEMVKSTNNSEEIKGFLKSASGEINHMINLVQDLLLLARIESGKDSISLDWVRVDEILLQVVSRLQKLATQKNISILTNFSSEVPNAELDVEFKGDEELLASMLENFIENAIKYSPEGKTVFVSLESRHLEFVIEIRDEGPGISPSEQKRIFDRFQRERAAGTQGSGLGLAVAQEIARLHEVEVKVESDPENEPGTRVIVVFPKQNKAV